MKLTKHQKLVLGSIFGSVIALFLFVFFYLASRRISQKKQESASGTSFSVSDSLYDLNEATQSRSIQKPKKIDRKVRLCEHYKMSLEKALKANSTLGVLEKLSLKVRYFCGDQVLHSDLLNRLPSQNPFEDVLNSLQTSNNHRTHTGTNASNAGTNTFNTETNTSHTGTSSSTHIESNVPPHIESNVPPHIESNVPPHIESNVPPLIIANSSHELGTNPSPLQEVNPPDTTTNPLPQIEINNSISSNTVSSPSSPNPLNRPEIAARLESAKRALIACGAIASNHPALNEFPKESLLIGDFLNDLDCRTDVRLQAADSFVEVLSSYHDDPEIADKWMISKTLEEIRKLRAEVDPILKSNGVPEADMPAVSKDLSIESLINELNAAKILLKNVQKVWMWDAYKNLKKIHNLVVKCGLNKVLSGCKQKPPVIDFLESFNSTNDSYSQDFLSLFVQMLNSLSSTETNSLAKYLEAYRDSWDWSNGNHSNLPVTIFIEMIKEMQKKCMTLEAEIYSSLRDGPMGIMNWAVNLNKNNPGNAVGHYQALATAITNVCSTLQIHDEFSKNEPFIVYYLEYLRIFKKILERMHINQNEKVEFFFNSKSLALELSKPDISEELLCFVSDCLRLKMTEIIHQFLYQTQSNLKKEGVLLPEDVLNERRKELVVKVFEGISEICNVDPVALNAYEKVLAVSWLDPYSSANPRTLYDHEFIDLQNTISHLPLPLKNRVINLVCTIPCLSKYKSVFTSLR